MMRKEDELGATPRKGMGKGGTDARCTALYEESECWLWRRTSFAGLEALNEAERANYRHHDHLGVK